MTEPFGTFESNFSAAVATRKPASVSVFSASSIFMPTTFGIVNGSRPFETVRSTAVSRLTCSPSFRPAETTVPTAACSSHASVTAPACRFAPASAALASAKESPTSFGTG